MPVSMTQAPVATRITCSHCAAAYLPSLVKGVCPVCRTPAPGAVPPRRSALGEDDRLLLIVALATLANLVLLAVLGVAVLS